MEKINTGISERIEEIIRGSGLSKNAFALALGYNRSQIIYDITGSSPSVPGYEFFYRLMNSDISASVDLYWLITGKRKAEDNQATTEIVPLPEDSNIQLVNFIASQAKEIGRLEERTEALEREVADLRLELIQRKSGNSVADVVCEPSVLVG